MILDGGICKIGRIVPGDTPLGTLAELSECWYGELDYASSPFSSDDRVDVQEERRIRIHQDRRITGLYGVVIDGARYEVTRVFHGRDEESGERITDLTLRRVQTGGYGFG